jgi:hypothetical protein
MVTPWSWPVGVQQHVNAPAFALMGDRAALYAPSDCIGADPELVGGLVDR